MNSWCGGYFYHFNHQQYFHKSCVSYNKIIDSSPHSIYQPSLFSIWNVYFSYYHFDRPQFFKILCHSLLQQKSTVPVLYQRSLPLIRMDIRALPLRSTAPLPGGPPPPASDGGHDPGLCSVYMIIWISLALVYNNQRSISLDYPGQDQLPNWLSGAPQPLAIHGMNAFTPSYCGRDADSVASSHSTPIQVQYCLYSESGLFWAI